MDLGRDDWIGLRVARWRDVAGMRQEDLAAKVGVSREYISLIENGHRPVTKRSLLIALAEAVGVSVAELIAQPASAHTRADQEIHDAVPGVRSALDGAEDPPPRPLVRLAADVDRAMRARMACDYPELAELLGPLIAETQALAENGSSDRALNLFAQVCVTASLALKPFGYVDLATRLAERGQWAAARTGEPVHAAAAEFARAQASLAGGVRGLRARSLAIATRAAGRIQGNTSNDARTWYGMLHLQAALSAASLGRADDASMHLAEATDVVQTVDGDPWRMEFTAANVGVWRVGVALENGDAGRAPEYARRVDQTKLRTVQRRAHLHVHTGRGLYLAGRHDEAVSAFLEADRVSSREVRSRPTVREIVGHLVRDARRPAGSEALRDLAVKVGVDPLALET